MCGGSSAKSDRKTQLTEEGNLDKVAGSLRDVGSKLITGGAAATRQGLDDTSKASKYYSDILSGDPTKVAAAVAPETKALVGQAEQQKKQIANFGNRTGGTNAITQNIDASTRGTIGDAILKARGSAAGGLERTGSEASRVGLAETGEGVGATATAGSEFQSLISDAIQSRQVSQKIHDQAVEDWGTVIGDLIGAL